MRAEEVRHVLKHLDRGTKFLDIALGIATESIGPLGIDEDAQAIVDTLKDGIIEVNIAQEGVKKWKEQ